MLGLYARCVFHMRPSQAAWFLWRRGLGLQGGAPGAAAPSLRRRVSIGPRLGPPTLQPAVTFRHYDAGHMFYLNPPDRARMHADLAAFIRGTTG